MINLIDTMKKIVLSLVLVFAVSVGASAQSWKDLLGKAVSEVADNASSTAAGSAVTNILGQILGSSLTLSYEALEGTWDYEGVACVLESEDALSNIGGSVVTGTLESKLDEKLALLGVTKGNCSFTFAKDQTCVINVGNYAINGKYELDIKEKVIVFTFMYDKLPIKTYVSYEIQTLNVVFKADRLLSFIKNVASYFSNNGATGAQQGQLQAALQAVGAMGTLLENYDGMMLGAKLSKAASAASTTTAASTSAAASTAADSNAGSAASNTAIDDAGESSGSKLLKGLGGLLKK